MATWKNYVRSILDGSPVDAATTMAPIVDLIGRTDYLKEALDAATSGSALVEFDVPLDVSTVVCTPVYIDTDGVWKPALTAVYTSGAQIGRLMPSAFVSGIVISKTAADRGHVLLGGTVPDLPWSNVIADTSPGVVYLDFATAGKLTKQRTFAAVPVGTLIADGKFLFARYLDSAAEDHQHFSFALAGRPAVGAAVTITPPSNPDPHVIDVGDIDLTTRGWVPVDHPSTPPYPVGAKFWYNIDVDAGLADSFPPIPIVAYAFTQGNSVVPVAVVMITANGIFWMTDSYGTVPWPLDFTNQTPTDIAEDVVFSYAKLTGNTVSRAVSSLTSAANSALPFKLLDPSGNEASIGDLSLFLDPALFLPVSPTADTGFMVVRRIENGVQFVGRAVTGIKLGTAGLKMTASDIASGVGAGVVTLSLVAAEINLYLEPRVIRHVGTQENVANEANYISFPSGRNTNAVYQFSVPRLGVPTSSSMSLIVSLLGLGVSALPDLVLTYRVYTAGQTQPSSWTALTTITGQSVASGALAEVTAGATIPGVKPGDEVTVNVSRAGATDSYTAAVGILKITAALAAS